MKKIPTLLLILGSLTLLLLGCLPSGDKTNPPSIEESEPPTAFCKLDQVYERNAVTPVPCQCPEGYEFKVIRMGWGPCPQEGMSDCAAADVKCVEKPPPTPLSECEKAGGKLTTIQECDGSKSDWCILSEKIHCYADLVKDGQCDVEFSEKWYQETGEGMIGPGSGPRILCGGLRPDIQ